MTRPLDYRHGQEAQKILNFAVEKADQIHLEENRLIEILTLIDQKKYYARYGYKSLKGFCLSGLKFSRTQSQRIVTRVRRTA